MRLRRDFPKDDETVSFGTVPFVEQFVGDVRQRLLTLLAAVGLVLLIACGNVANLLLARGAARAREIAVRTALGAGRGRIVRQLLTESVVLALCAARPRGCCWRARSSRRSIAWSPNDVPRLEQAHIDPMALGFAIAIALVSSVLCGLAPALRVSRRDVQSGLRDGGRGSTGGLRDRLRGGLIVAEVALSLLLLVGAGLLIRSAIALQRTQHRLRAARRAERARDAAGDQLRRAGAHPRDAAADQRGGGGDSRASRRRRSPPMPRWAAAAAATGWCPKAASRSPPTSSTARCA